jgi:hypothetical protein
MIQMTLIFGCNKRLYYLSFQPPGQLSAGLNCEFTVTFDPKVSMVAAFANI